MAFNYGIERPLVTQTFRTFALPIVGAAAAVPLDVSGSKQQLVTNFGISNALAGGTSVFVGNAGVTDTVGANPGFEVQSGTLPFFRELQEGRQLYELQVIFGQILQLQGCQSITLEKIPFVVFNLSEWFVFSPLNVTITVITFPCMYL